MLYFFNKMFFYQDLFGEIVLFFKKKRNKEYVKNYSWYVVLGYLFIVSVFIYCQFSEGEVDCIIGKLFIWIKSLKFFLYEVKKINLRLV